MRYSATVLIQQPDESREFVQSICDTLPGVPVLLNFDCGKVFGQVATSRMDESAIVVEFDAAAECEGMFAGPGYKIESGQQTATALSLGVIAWHQDHVGPIVKID